ncbi:high-affinity branched-chain amino acid transport ATP-binding protein [Salmonella enterica subsp. enterica serovar Poona]|nr:high-affinity branched-chain amino acid transport ATP-binding protein [Salmonella enterica subsp. enterica serovar Poona]
MEKTMLTFEKVSAHYGKIQALHDVSLHINQGGNRYPDWR